MKRQDVIGILTLHRKELNLKGVKSLYLFGSVAREEASAESDVDILVDFEPDAHIGLFEFLRLQYFLSDILHCKVDLATPDSLQEEMREQILREAIHAA